MSVVSKIRALYYKFPFILIRNLAKTNCTENQVCTSCDIVVLDFNITDVFQLPLGSYGSAVQELDAGVGAILNELRETGLANNTLVVFSSDNGAALVSKFEGMLLLRMSK